MLKTNQLNYIIRLWLDVVVLLACFALACFIEIGSLTGIFKPPLVVILSSSLVVWYFGARILLLYREMILFSFSQEMTVFLKQLLLHLLVLIFLLFIFYRDFYQYRSFILVYHALILSALPFEKFFYRLIVAYVRKQYKYEKNILLVGNGYLGTNFYQSRILNNDLKYNIVGVIDDEEKDFFNAKYLGKIDAFEEILKTVNVDEVIIALQGNVTAKVDRIIDACEKAAKRVSILPEFNKFGAGALQVTNYAGFPIVNIRYYPLDDLENKFFKRLFDIIFSTFFLVFIFSWMFPVIALAIKLNSKGPVFFKQERWGLNNKKIICYKFRTMYIASKEVDENGNYIQTKQNDERITGVGKFLRKTSLDELPQFMNVLAGSMSVVGPRPHPIPLTIESKDLVQNYMLRHVIKPGISGWAQVNGSRGETNQPGDMQKRVDLDLWYIENWSFWLDYQIIFQTMVNMIKGDKKAY